LGSKTHNHQNQKERRETQHNINKSHNYIVDSAAKISDIKPMKVPMITEIPTAIIPTDIEILVPYAILENTSVHFVGSQKMGS